MWSAASTLLSSVPYGSTDLRLARRTCRLETRKRNAPVSPSRTTSSSIADLLANGKLYRIMEQSGSRRASRASRQIRAGNVIRTRHGSSVWAQGRLRSARLVGSPTITRVRATNPGTSLGITVVRLGISERPAGVRRHGPTGVQSIEQRAAVRAPHHCMHLTHREALLKRLVLGTVGAQRLCASPNACVTSVRTTGRRDVFAGTSETSSDDPDESGGRRRAKEDLFHCFLRQIEATANRLLSSRIVPSRLESDDAPKAECLGESRDRFEGGLSRSSLFASPIITRCDGTAHFMPTGWSAEGAPFLMTHDRYPPAGRAGWRWRQVSCQRRCERTLHSHAVLHGVDFTHHRCAKKLARCESWPA